MNIRKMLMSVLVCFSAVSAYCEMLDGTLIEFDCIQKADVKNLEEILKNGGDPNLTDAQGNTVLIMASTFGQVDTVKVLLAHGADVNLQDQNGNTALMTACKNNRIEIVKLLLEKKSDVDLTNKTGDNCLTLALSKGFGEIAKLLLDSENHFIVTSSLMSATAKCKNIDLLVMLKEKFTHEPEYTKAIDRVINKNLNSKVKKGVSSSAFKNTITIAVVIMLCFLFMLLAVIRKRKTLSGKNTTWAISSIIILMSLTTVFTIVFAPRPHNESQTNSKTSRESAGPSSIDLQPSAGAENKVLIKQLKDTVLNSVKFDKKTNLDEVVKVLNKMAKKDNKEGREVSIELDPSDPELLKIEMEVEIEQVPLNIIICYICKAAGLKWWIIDDKIIIGKNVPRNSSVKSGNKQYIHQCQFIL